MRFQFDRAKVKSNFNKHNVSFAEAATVFYAPLAIHMEDADYEQEDRWIAAGMGSTGKILVVVNMIRLDAIRLLSARRATPREVRQYGG